MVKFSKKWVKKTFNNGLYLECYFTKRLHNSPRYNPNRLIQWPRWRWPWLKVKVKGQANSIKSNITAFCDSFGRYPPVIVLCSGICNSWSRSKWVSGPFVYELSIRRLQVRASICTLRWRTRVRLMRCWWVTQYYTSTVFGHLWKKTSKYIDLKQWLGSCPEVTFLVCVCVCVCVCVFLHLHEIVEGLYFYFSLSVCVCVCVCLSVCPFVNKMPAKPLHRFWRGLR